MKKVKLYGFYYSPYENNKGKAFKNLQAGKLYSKFKNDIDNPQSLGKILFSPPGSQEYSASMKLPTKEIVFYDFFARDNSLVLDDFMRTPEINYHFGFFVSQKIKNILTIYTLPDHIYYPVNIHFQDNIYSYYFLLISYKNNGVDYKKSTFVESYDESKKVNILEYEDLIEQQIFEEDGSKYWTEKDVEEKEIILNKEIDIYPSLTLKSSPFYFSEKLKESLEKEGVTGIEIYSEEEDDLEF